MWYTQVPSYPEQLSHLPTTSCLRGPSVVTPITATCSGSISEATISFDLLDRLRTALHTVAHLLAVAALDTRPVLRLSTLAAAVPDLIAVATLPHFLLFTLLGTVALLPAVVTHVRLTRRTLLRKMSN